MDIPDPLSPLLPIVHRLRQFFSSCMYVLAGRPASAGPYVSVHWSTSVMSSSLLLQQCPACLVRLTWIVFVMGGRWPNSWCFVGCCTRNYSILLSTFLCNCCLASSPAALFASHVVHPYSNIDTNAAWKKLHFILSVMFDFHMIDSL